MKINSKYGNVNKALDEVAVAARKAHLSYGQYQAGMKPDTFVDTTSRVNFWWKKEK